MTNLILEVSDELARSLEGLAAAQHKSVEQVAIERLSSLVTDERPGSPAALLKVVREGPHLTSADVDELDRAIASGRLTVEARDLFRD